ARRDVAVRCRDVLRRPPEEQALRWAAPDRSRGPNPGCEAPSLSQERTPWSSRSVRANLSGTDCRLLALITDLEQTARSCTDQALRCRVGSSAGSSRCCASAPARA